MAPIRIKSFNPMTLVISALYLANGISILLFPQLAVVPGPFQICGMPDFCS
jgi:hypothetical protein